MPIGAALSWDDDHCDVTIISAGKAPIWWTGYAAGSGNAGTTHYMPISYVREVAASRAYRLAARAGLALLADLSWRPCAVLEWGHGTWGIVSPFRAVWLVHVR